MKEPKKHKLVVITITADSGPALSKMFQDFGFFFDVNQIVTTNLCLSNTGSNSEKEL